MPLHLETLPVLALLPVGATLHLQAPNQVLVDDARGEI